MEQKNKQQFIVRWAASNSMGWKCRTFDAFDKAVNFFNTKKNNNSTCHAYLELVETIVLETTLSEYSA